MTTVRRVIKRVIIEQIEEISDDDSRGQSVCDNSRQPGAKAATAALPTLAIIDQGGTDAFLPLLARFGYRK